jgi:hypothetical protein
MSLRGPGLPNTMLVAMVAGCLVLGATGDLRAQSPGSQTGPRPVDPHSLPQGLPSVPSMMGPSAAAPVIPDTARVEFDWSEGSTLPTSLAVVPDTVLFGDIVAVVCEFPAGATIPALTDVTWPAEWLSVADEVSNEYLDRLESIIESGTDQRTDAGTSARLLIPVRVYRADPFQLASGSIESAVIHVRGRTTDLAETAGIRGPRAWGWNLWTVAALALV